MALLILYTLLGGLTGYGTNHYAIEMLFRRFWRFGGVIVATKHQLAEELGLLVEREIINNRTIQNELTKEKFKAAFNVVISDLLQRQLPKNIPDARICDLPGMNRTQENVLAFARTHLPGAVRQAMDLLATHGVAGDLVSRGQCAHVAARVYDLGLDVVRADGLVVNLLEGLYREVRGRDISGFVRAPVFQAVAGSTGHCLSDLHRRLERDFDPQIDGIIGETYALLDIDGLVAVLTDRLVRRTPAELVGPERAEDLAGELLNRCVEFLGSPEGGRLVDGFAAEAMAVLKEVRTPLLELLGGDLQARVEAFLRRELPSVVERLIIWIRDHQAEIEGLVEDTIDDVLDAEAQTTLSGLLKKWLKDAFVPNMAARYSVTDRIVKAIESGNTGDLSRQLSGEIIGYLRARTVAEVVADLEERDILTADLIAALTRRNLEMVLPGLRLDDGFLHKEVGAFVERGALAGLWKRHGWPALRQYIKGILYSPDATRFVQREISRGITGLGQRTVAEIIPPASVGPALAVLEEWIVEECAARRDPWAAPLTASIQTFTRRWLAGDAARRVLAARACPPLMGWVEQQVRAVGKQRVLSLYGLVGDSPGAADTLTSMALDLTDRHLEGLLKGNIRTAVKSNLAGLPDDDLREKVQGFIGGELRPITRLGGLIGLLGGPVSLLPGFTAAPLGLIAYSAALFGVIGYGTNALALRMLFRPHRAWRVFNRRLPLTPGVIPHNQARFAREMSAFIKDELLDQKTVRAFFAGIRAEAEAGLLQAVAAGNYRSVRDLIRQEQPRMVGFVVREAVGYAACSRDALAASLARLPAGIDPGGLDFDPLRGRLAAGLKDALPQLGTVLAGEIAGQFRSDRTLGAILPEAGRQGLVRLATGRLEAALVGAARGLEDNGQFQRWMEAAAPAFDRLADRTPGDLAGARGEEWQARVVSLFMGLLTPSVTGPVISFIEDRLARELDPQRRVGEVFDGFLVNLMEANIDHVLDHLTEQARSYLRRERPRLIMSIARAVRRDRNWLERLGLGLLNVDETVALVVDKLVNKRVPGYLEKRKQELRAFAQASLFESITGKTLGEIGLDLDRGRFRAAAAHLVDDPAVTRVVAHLAGGVVGSLFDIPVRALLRIVSLDTFAHVSRVFAAEIRTARLELAGRLRAGRAPVLAAAEPLVGDFMDRYLFTLTLRRVLGDVPREQIGWSVDRLLQATRESTVFDLVLEGALDRLAGEIRRRRPADLMDLRVLEADIGSAIDRLTACGRFHSDLRALLSRLTDPLVHGGHPQVLAVLDPDTVDYVLRTGAGALMDSLQDHLGDIVNAVDIGGVAQRELGRLNPSEIEGLFDSFARAYFTKLKLYGLGFGSLIGAGTGLGHLILQALR